MRILVLEPYHGASHKRFLDELERNLPFEFVRLTQPPRAWKWRMRFSAPFFAQELAGHSSEEFDLVLASTHLSLADFRGLAPGGIGNLPTIVYWHENQWAYPVRAKDERDRHFVITNFTTALAADLNLFNSEWNRASLMDGLKQVLREVPDTKLLASLNEIAKKSQVAYPTIDAPTKPTPTHREEPSSAPPCLLWNHRWEHDKNPEEFFDTLIKLSQEGVLFELVVAGQSFRKAPDIFATARTTLDDHITHWGYVAERSQYEELLHRADYVVSTAIHEFFGLSVLEAALAGAFPVVPDHLSYPELYPKECRYPPGGLGEHLTHLLNQPSPSTTKLSKGLEQFLWREQKPFWEQTFRTVAGNKREP